MCWCKGCLPMRSPRRRVSPQSLMVCVCSSDLKRALPCLALSWLVLDWLGLAWLGLSCFGLAWLVLSCLVLSCLVLSCLVLSCLVLSCLVVCTLVFKSPPNHLYLAVHQATALHH